MCWNILFCTLHPFNYALLAAFVQKMSVKNCKKNKKIAYFNIMNKIDRQNTAIIYAVR